MSNLAKTFTMQDMIASAPQEHFPVRHHFAPGVYVREIFMKAGTLVIGKMHKTEHFNEIIAGVVRVLDPDTEEVIEHMAGDIFTSKPGVKKILYIVNDCVWRTIHVTQNTDMKLLEAELILPEDKIRDGEGNILLEDDAMQKLLGVPQ